MPFKHILLALLVAVVWGCNFIFVKIGVHEIPPLFLCAIRFFLVSIPAIFFIRLPQGAFKILALYGLVMFALQFALIFIGIALGVSAGMASLLTQTAVFFSILFAAVFIGEMPTIWQITGAALSFSGIALAAAHINGDMTLTGFLLVIAGAASSGFGNLMTRKLGHIKMPVLVSWGCFFAFPPLLICSLLIEGTTQILYSMHHFSTLAIVSLIYIVYVSTWVGYGTWCWLLGRYPVSSVVPFTVLIPVFAMLGSALFLGERFEPWKMAVSGLVLSGLCVNLLAPRFLGRRKVVELSLKHSEV
jgi:O-acetylserine/cysteine efflux transporter